MSCVAAGWLGCCKVGGHVLPFKSAQATKEVQIITPQGIGGRTSRYYNKYSLGKHSYKASASFQLFTAYSAAAQWLLTKASNVCPFRYSDGTFQFCPAGSTTYTLPGSSGTAAIDALSLSCVAGDGSGVQGSVSIVSTAYDSDDSGLAGLLVYEDAGALDDGNFIPWYNTDITATGLADSSLINNYAMEWSLNIKNDIYTRYGLCASETARRNPQAVRYGLMDVTGSIKYWSPDGSFSDEEDDTLSLTIDLSAFTIRCSNVIIQNVVPNNGPNAPVCKEIQFRALGDCEGGAPITVS